MYLFENLKVLKLKGYFMYWVVLNFINNELVVLFPPEKSLLNKFIVSCLQCLQEWYCTYKIILIISKINTVFPVHLYRESLLVGKKKFTTLL